MQKEDNCTEGRGMRSVTANKIVATILSKRSPKRAFSIRINLTQRFVTLALVQALLVLYIYNAKQDIIEREGSISRD